MKSRLSFASLAHIDPEILIIDEALSVGDAFFAAKATRMILDLCARGRIVLLVSHSVGSIKQMCQRCIWLEGGHMKADGPAEDVAQAYAASTRARLEVEIARKFGDRAQSWMSDSSAALSAPSLVRGSNRVQTVMIEAGTAAALEVTLSAKRPLATAKLRVTIESNDGLLLAEEQVRLDSTAAGPGEYRLSLGLGYTDWRPALYQAQIEIIENETSIARTSVAFKVFSDEIIFGGSPLLRTAPLMRLCSPPEPAVTGNDEVSNT